MVRFENKKASVMGIEPTTYGLGGRRSTFELHGLVQLLDTRTGYKSQLTLVEGERLVWWTCDL